MAVSSVLMLALIVTLGELSALAALIKGAGTLLEAFLVWLAITVILQTVIFEFMRPVILSMKPGPAVVMAGGSNLAWLVGSLAYFIFLVAP